MLDLLKEEVGLRFVRQLHTQEYGFKSLFSHVLCSLFSGPDFYSEEIPWAK